MSDQTSDVLHRTMTAIVGTAPEAPSLAASPVPASTRRRSPMLVAATAFVFVLAVGAFTLVLGGGGSTLGAYPAAASAEAQGVALDFVFGADPHFDTSTLGTEMVPEEGDSAEWLDETSVVESAQSRNPAYQMVGMPWYVGQLGGTHAFVVDFATPDGSEMSCRFLARNATQGGIGCFSPSDPDLLSTFSYNVDSPGIDVIVTTADPNVSVVSVQLGSGESYWQRPTRGLAFFVLEDSTESELNSITVSSYDSAGNIVATATST
ncbi:MAG: hypothetical protein QNJ77_13405 [Acidimicrobiia bacterium]|nr:hypothetical protein [Acidimicrobiia bacterium]